MLNFIISVLKERKLEREGQNVFFLFNWIWWYFICFFFIFNIFMAKSSLLWWVIVLTGLLSIIFLFDVEVVKYIRRKCSNLLGNHFLDKQIDSKLSNPSQLPHDYLSENLKLKSIKI